MKNIFNISIELGFNVHIQSKPCKVLYSLSWAHSDSPLIRFSVYDTRLVVSSNPVRG